MRILGQCQYCNDIGHYGRRATYRVRRIDGTQSDILTCAPCAADILTRFPGDYDAVYECTVADKLVVN